MENKLDLILTKLNQLETKIDSIEYEVKRVSKHVGFVDSLAQSGVVSAVSTLNSMFSRLNVMRLISDRNEIEKIENTQE